MSAASTTLDFGQGELAEFLHGFLGRPVHDLSIRHTEGGMSNPTYFVNADGWKAVLRKQPRMKLAKSAHAIDREYRVLQALAATDVPVPAAYHYHDDPAVLGTPFYLMEWLEGRVYTAYATPGLARQERTALFRSMCQTMARIHRLDYRAIGLGDFGRPGNYFERQISRWSQIWDQCRKGADDNPDLDALLSWLQDRIPQSETLALCHGDFRIGNVMVHPTEARVVGVLDWELSTLGHPLVDVAFNTQAWWMAPEENGGLVGEDLESLGIPDEARYLDWYYAEVGTPEPLEDVHRAFAMFRGAVGSISVAMRGEQGNGTLPDSARIGRFLSRAYARRGLAITWGSGR